MNNIVRSPLFPISVTMLLYIISMHFYSRKKNPFFNPILLSPLLLILILYLTGLDYSDYMKGGSVISLFIGPATAALALPLYRNIRILNRKRVIILLCGIFAGSVTAVVSVLVLSKITGLSGVLTRSILSKSVTVPIAVGITGNAGGLVSVTVAAVLVTGITGSFLAPFIIKLTRVKAPLSKGTAIGTSAHIIGTVKAFEMGEKEGSISSLSIGIAGIFTAFIVPAALLFL